MMMKKTKNRTKSITILLLCALILPFVGYYTAADIEDKLFDPQLAAFVWLCFMLLAIGSLILVNKIATKHYQFRALRPTVILAAILTLVSAGWIANSAWYKYSFFSGYISTKYTVTQNSSFPNQFLFKGRLTGGAADITIHRILSAKNLEKDKPIVLEIHSVGGTVKEAILITDFVKHYDINVEVVGKCISACTLILLSSQSRYIHPRAWIGFHAAYMVRPDRTTSYEAPALTYYDDILANYLEILGATPKFREQAKIQDSKAGFYPTYQELKEAGVINQKHRLYLPDNKAPSYL